MTYPLFEKLTLEEVEGVLISFGKRLELLRLEHEKTTLDLKILELNIEGTKRDIENTEKEIARRKRGQE